MTRAINITTLTAKVLRWVPSSTTPEMVDLLLTGFCQRFGLTQAGRRNYPSKDREEVLFEPPIPEARWDEASDYIIAFEEGCGAIQTLEWIAGSTNERESVAFLADYLGDLISEEQYAEIDKFLILFPRETASPSLLICVLKATAPVWSRLERRDEVFDYMVSHFLSGEVLPDKEGLVEALKKNEGV